MKHILCLLIMFGSLSLARTQPTQPLVISTLLEHLNGEILQPLDGDYRPVRIFDNPIQTYHWAIGSTREQLEIRFLVIPDEGQRVMDYPHLEASRIAMQVCSNEPDAAITARDLTEEERTNLFHADWGRIFMFPPNQRFGLYLHCKMITLFRENRGIMVIFQLFDEPSPAIDNRLHSFQFLDG